MRNWISSNGTFSDTEPVYWCYNELFEMELFSDIETVDLYSTEWPKIELFYV